ncbi:MAG: methyltransferase domain-containing protein [Bacteroidota bacterium]
MEWNANLYNQKHAFVYQFGSSLVEMLAPQAGEAILDIGCGTGELSSQISEHCKEVVGIDKSTNMITQAKQNYPALTFLEMDAASFQLDRQFDAIFSNATLHWVADFRGAIQCIYDHLRQGGRMVIEFGGKDNVGAILKALKDSLRQRGYIEQAAFNRWYFPSVGEYTSELEKAGFRVLSAEHYDRPTQLIDNENGIKDWLTMFGKDYLKGVSPGEADDILEEVQASLKPGLYQEGKWYADYKRLRIKATKE